MPLQNLQLDDQALFDVSVPLSGVNNSVPPALIDKSMAADAENRLAQLDGLNRPRPGILRLKAASGGSLDSIHHLGSGVFLANNGGVWYTYDNRSGVFNTVTGGPAYPAGAQVYSALANDTLYFSIGTTLNKYKGPNFGTVTLPTQYPTALYPIWALERLIYVYGNTLVVSDALSPEYFDVITGSVTLDPITTDVITGQAMWKNQRIVVFRNGSTWIVETGPDLNVPDWSVQRVSATIGTRCHGTIVQAGNDILFLSETGRGVYAMGQAPTSDEQGVWLPISIEAQGYIDRINWSACDNARATYWRDLYLLSVPLDKSTFNNFVLVYSMSLKQWQGLWCFDIGSTDVGVRDFARDRTDINYTVLLLATKDGVISRMTYPMERQYFDRNIDTSRQVYDSRLLSRAFTFGEDINQVRPHSARFQFLDSEDVVTITAIADRAVELVHRDLATTSYLLSLTIPGFPFDLDREGFKQQAIGLLKTGICTELQFRLEGTGNWTLYQIKASAFESMPLIST